MIFRRKRTHRSREEGSRSIYALIVPRDNTVRYIGCAIDIDERLRGHLRDRSNRIPLCKGTKLLCVRKMVLGVGREVALHAGLSTRVHGLAESGDVEKYSIAETILEAVNDLLVEQGQAEVVLADLGWVPLEW